MIIAGYLRWSTDFAANIAGDHKWLCLIMQDMERMTYAQMWIKSYTIRFDDTSTVLLKRQSAEQIRFIFIMEAVKASYISYLISYFLLIVVYAKSL